MRFDEFVQQNKVAVAAVDQFDGHRVSVAVPPDWEPVDAGFGTRVWVWRADPFKARFCATVVLTQSRVAAALDPAETFAMLCDWNAQMFPGTHEFSREVAAADDGPGILGRFRMLINADLGVLVSESLTRVITERQATLITQLTLTALADSPVDRAHLRLTVTPAESVDPVATAQPGPTAPIAGEGR